MELRLAEFLRTGELGIIRCGAPQEELLGKFGTPTSSREFIRKEFMHGAPPVIELRIGYDALGISFERGQVAQYGLYLDDEHEIPKFLNPVGYFPTGGKVSVSEFLEYMRTEGIQFQPRGWNDDIMFEAFTQGGVGIAGGAGVLFSLVRPCPGTYRWRVLRDRKSFRLHPPHPFAKKAES